MRQLLLLAVVGCGGPPAQKPVVVRNEVTKSTEVDPHSSQSAMVRATFARLSAGDADGLMALADPREAMARAFDCAPGSKLLDSQKEMERARKKLTRAAEVSKGTAIEVLEIISDEHGAPVMKAGEKFAECTVKVDIKLTRVKVRVRATTPGQQASEQTEHVELVAAGDRWYLEEAPRVGKRGNNEFMNKFDAYADRVCACSDASCLAAANDDFTKWVKDHPDLGDPEAEDMERNKTITKKLADCTAKLTQPTQPPTP